MSWRYGTWILVTGNGGDPRINLDGMRGAMARASQKRERETQEAQDALIHQLWKDGKDDKFIAEKVFKDASFEALVYRRRGEKGWLHTREARPA